MQKYVIFTIIIFFMALTAGCTISHEFGPFMGKVVDAETGEPIEGAVVLIGFFIETGTFGGTAYRFADAVETLTDVQGEFAFDPKRVDLFKVMSSWSDDHTILIFKPVYGVYPGHRQAYSSWKYKQALIIPENEYVTYYLPKLKTLKERKENLNDVLYPAGITNEKCSILQRLKSVERVNVGLKP